VRRLPRRAWPRGRWQPGACWAPLPPRVTPPRREYAVATDAALRAYRSARSGAQRGGGRDGWIVLAVSSNAYYTLVC